MDAISQKEISRRLSDTLDCLGYSKEMVVLRQEYYRMRDMLCRKIFSFDSNERLVTAGSRGEGIIKMFESDYDVLFETKFFVCVDNQQTSQYLPDTATPLMIPCIYHPGHFKLFLQPVGLNTAQTNPISQIGILLSHTWFFNIFPKKIYEGISGPALFSKDIYLDYDQVFTFPCICPSIHNRWLNRPRKHNWPSVELRHKISQMSGNMVANGVSGCDDEDNEWRLCFNEIECLLVGSWNDTQTKLYKMLKMVKSDIIKPQKKEVTSFMLKNVVLWLSEEYPQSNFRRDNLFNWVVKALRFLKRAIKHHYLPYYMIPERNLLVERIQKSQQGRLVKQIRDIIKCGSDLLAECEKIKFSMKMCPVELALYKTKINLIEKNWVRWDLHQYIRQLHGIPNSQMEEIAPEMLHSLWPQAVQKELDKCSTTREMFIFLLS